MTTESWIRWSSSKCLKLPRRCRRPLHRNRPSLIVFAPSIKISGTLRSAQTAALEFPGLSIRVIDTMTISCNLGSLVLLADDLAKDGKSSDEIANRVSEMIPRGRLYFVVDTLEYLVKGGRIG